MPAYARRLFAEGLGTALLVFFAVGTATEMFGFKLEGTSTAAGVVATAFAFGLVLLVLAYAFGPISGCHINPAVTIGFVTSRRISLADAVGYWLAQIVGGILGAVALWGVLSGSSGYSRGTVGLGANGFGALSTININMAGAFAAEVILTFLFVMVILEVTSKAANPAMAGLAIGLTLATVHLIGIPITGTSVNPARSIGPALIVGGEALRELWLFIVAPLVGGIVAAMVHVILHAEPREGTEQAAAPLVKAGTPAH